MEFLTKLIKGACIEHRWTPFYIHRNIITIFNLLFADDILLFGKANVKTVDALLKTLDQFHDQSGLKMNPQKSMVYISKNT